MDPTAGAPCAWTAVASPRWPSIGDPRAGGALGHGPILIVASEGVLTAVDVVSGSSSRAEVCVRAGAAMVPVHGTRRGARGGGGRGRGRGITGAAARAGAFDALVVDGGSVQYVAVAAGAASVWVGDGAFPLGTARGSVGVAASGGRAYVLGGTRSDDGQPSRRVDMVTADARSVAGPDMPAPRAAHATAALAGAPARTGPQRARPQSRVTPAAPLAHARRWHDRGHRRHGVRGGNDIR